MKNKNYLNALTGEVKNFTKNPAVENNFSFSKRKIFPFIFLFIFIAFAQYSSGQTQNFNGSGSNALSASKWSANNAASCNPGNNAFNPGSTAVFCTVGGTCTGGSIAIGGITATEDITLSLPSGTITNQGNGVVTISVSNGKTIDFGAQAITGANGAGYIKTGAGTLAWQGAGFGGGFTLNAGTVVVEGTNAMGGGNTADLTINGGTIAANANRNIPATKYVSGIVVGGNFTLGSSTLPAVSSANITLNNAMTLGNSSSRTITIGGTGTYTLNDTIAGNNSNLTIAATAAGTIVMNTNNTYSGLTTLTGGTLQLNNTGGATLPATNNVTVTGGTLKISSDQTLNNLTLSTGTLVIDPGVTLTINGTLTYTSGTLTDNGTLEIEGTMNAASNQVTGTGVLTVDGTFKTSKTQGFSGSATTAVINTITITGSLTSIVDYTSASSQTITSGAYATLNNSGNGTRTLSSTGSIVIAVSFSPGTGLYTIGTSTVNFITTANITSFPVPSVSSGGNYYNLSFTGGGTVTMVSNLTVGNNLTINGTVTFRLSNAAAGNTLTVNNDFDLQAGTFTGNGSGGTGTSVLNVLGDFTQSGGTVTLNNAGATTGIVNVSVTGTFGLTGGVFRLITNNTAGSTNVTVSGAVSVNAGGTDGIYLESTGSASGVAIFQTNSGASFQGVSTSLVDFGLGNATGNEFRIKGNFSKSGTGTFTTASTTTVPNGFVFNGTGTQALPQTLSYSGTTSNKTNYVVNSNTAVKLLSGLTLGTSSTFQVFATSLLTGILDFDTWTLSGTSTSGFYTDVNSTLITANSNGIYFGSTSSISTAIPTVVIGISPGTNYIFNGASAQSTHFKSNPSPQQLSNLTVNNSNDITLTEGITIDGILAFTNGKINNPSPYQVLFNSNATTIGAGPGKFITGTGTVRIDVAIGNTTKTIPIGDALYAGVNITFTGSGATVAGNIITTVAATDANEGATLSGINQSQKVNRYWFLNATPASLGTYDITLNFESGNVLGGSTSNFVIRKFSSSAWATTTLAVGGALATSTKATGLTSFSDFEIGVANTVIAGNDPSNDTKCQGGTATFTTTASLSLPTPAIKWQEKVGAGAFTDINDAGIYSGSTTTTLTITGVTIGMSGNLYRANFRNINSSGSATTTAAATLTVNVPSSAPTGISGTTTLCNGDPTTLTATGGTLGSGANYQWGTGATPGVNPLGGQIASTLNVSPTASTTYWVRIENTTAPCTGTTSGVTQVVTVNQPSSAPTGISGTTTLCNGDPTALTATGGALGSGANYQWGTGTTPGVNPLLGETTSTLNVSPPVGNTTYWVRIENTTAPCTGPTSGVTQLVTVNTLSTAPTSVTSDDANNEICSGQSVLLTANGGALGSSPGASYNWYEGGCGTGSSISSTSTLTVTPSAGSHTYYARIEDACGNTSCASLVILVTSGLPSNTPGSVIAPSTACSGQTGQLITVNALVGPNLQYSWNTGSNSSVVLFSTSAGGPYTTGPFATPTNQVYAQFGALAGGQSGYQICVQGTNACGNTNNKCVWIRGVVSGTGPITPPDGVVACPNTSQLYSCGTSAGATVYTWTLNGLTGPITPNGGNNPTNVSVAFPSGFTTGQLCVTAALSCGGASTSAPRCITINKNPANPTVLSGTGTVCPGAPGVPYSIPAVPGASGYNWTVPANATIATGANTTSITVDFPTPYNGSPSVCVTATSGCGASANRCKTVVSGIPNQPAGITGPLTNICGSTVQYSVVSPPGGLTYTWTNPSGTTISGSATGSTILLNVSPAFTNGFLTVVANSALCAPATSASRTSSTVWGRPNNPGAITANPTLWCTGGFVNFSTTPASPLPTYTWTVSNGTIGAGQGSSNIDVTWGATAAGTVTVKASNSCGISAGTSSQSFTAGCREEGINASSATAFSVYPNPAHDKVTVSIDVNENAHFAIQLMDVSGRVVVSESLSGSAGLNTYELNLSHLSKGVYMLEVKSVNDNWRKKVIIE